ncbi:GntR family transcriptional regulator [Nonomuraea sp. NPDC050153]|uniref:GntR family transcriptional regulator n=1 Tax=Nonomuraea sp. NPDC050153 TaxID=3364359 RepID=UPI00378FDE4A
MDEFQPPKYAQIVQAITGKIADGTYPPGSLLPSETQLVKEFGVSRPTVVRALQVLQLRNVIDREHGRGSYVKAAPALSDAGSKPSRAMLDRSESNEGGTVVRAGWQSAPRPVARLLDLEDNAPVMMRRVLFHDGERPTELVTFWAHHEIANGAELDQASVLSVGLRQHLQTVKRLRLQHVVERLSARHPSADEAKILEIGKGSAVLGVVATVFDASGRAVLVVDQVMPGSLHELEDSYAL